jgi:hypothetical protein
VTADLDDPKSLDRAVEGCDTMFLVSFIDGGKREYTEKTTDLSQGTDKPYHLMIAQVVVNPTIIRSRSRRPLMVKAIASFL